jgi:hypothetical protein
MQIQSKPDCIGRKPHPALCISLGMNAFTLRLVTVVLGLFLLGGCNRSGGGLFGGSSSPTGDTGKQQQPQQKQGGGMKQTEPAASVSGQPSTASDNGSSTAVGHRSVAEPGAPEGTAPRKPGPRSSQH